MAQPVVDKYAGEALVLLEVGCANTVPRVAAQLGLSPDEADQCLRSCIGAGFAAVVGNRTVFSMTPHGKVALQEYLAGCRLDFTPPVATVLANFRVTNDQFKSELAAYLRDGAQNGLDGVIDAIASAHLLLCKLDAWGVRYGGYRRRLDSAVARVLAGRDEYLVRTGSESVHNAWWEWHEDLLVTTGTRRVE